MPLDLQALAAAVRVQARISSPSAAIKARMAQRASAEYAAELAARAAEKRESLTRALSSDSMDAMRFRWFAENQGFSIDDWRKHIDAQMRAEATRRIAEMRALDNALTGKARVAL